MLPLPRLTATCAELGRPPVKGSELNRNSSAPCVATASSTVVSVPRSRQWRIWYQVPSGTVGATPSRAQAHSTSSEQSKASGSASVAVPLPEHVAVAALAQQQLDEIGDVDHGNLRTTGAPQARPAPMLGAPAAPHIGGGYRGFAAETPTPPSSTHTTGYTHGDAPAHDTMPAP